MVSTCSNLSKDLLVDAASGWARTWGMLFNPEKSKHLAIKAAERTVRKDGICLPKRTTHSHLGVTVNETLSWDDHISKLYTDCARRIGILRRLRKKAQLDYFPKDFHRRYPTKYKIRLCSVVWRTNWEDCKAAGRLLPKTPNPSSAALKKRFEHHTLTLFFKMKHHMVPQYLSSLVPAPTSESSQYSFRKLSYTVPLVSKTTTIK